MVPAKKALTSGAARAAAWRAIACPLPASGEMSSALSPIIKMFCSTTDLLAKEMLEIAIVSVSRSAPRSRSPSSPFSRWIIAQNASVSLPLRAHASSVASRQTFTASPSIRLIPQ